MTNETIEFSPLAVAAEPIGGDAAAAFATLGNETRLAILVALWDAYDPETGDDELSFSALQRRVGVADSGQFNYHLGKLEDRFVEVTDGGYRLRPAGLEFVQMVVAGAGRSTSLPPTEIDADCPLCGSATVVVYREGWFYQLCTACSGGFGRGEGYPEGILFGEPLSPAALVNRTPEELFAAAVGRLFQVMNMKLSGFCPLCTGVIETTTSVCKDHDAGTEGVCDACGNAAVVRLQFVCRVCKYRGSNSPGGAVATHPAVVAFYHERGVEVGYPADDFESARTLIGLVRTHETEVLATDPLRVRVTVRYDGDELWLTLDEDMDVLETVEGSSDGA